ncbi:hypothetical protein RND81_10G158200 [Saponaria officinalis]|uniref:DUF2828 domain-containing protein n=1 Tax=Saponaria officinalis TaxID=3572 RepID=A0AAW1I517_SAPOF
MAPTLVGPPKHRRHNPTSAVTTTDPFLNTILSNFNSALPFDLSNPKTGLTDNLSPTFLDTGNPCLDLFFDVVPGTRSRVITQKLLDAWDHDPLITLKLICNLRGVRGTGKSDKNGFYTAAIWLHQHHPKTLACNLGTFAEFGYFKDFPEILYRVMGLTHTAKMKRVVQFGRPRAPFATMKKKGQMNKGKKKGKKSQALKEFHMREAADKQVIEKEKASEMRHEKKEEMAKKLIVKFNHDPEFRFLHERISDLFSRRLRADMAALNAGELGKISLAAKWCPSLDSTLDRATLLCEAIARKMFPKDEYKEEYGGLEEVHYAYRVRDRLRKEVLVPLRKALELPEIFMGGNRWGELKYNRVASVAMRNYKDVFLKHDEERFNKYLEDVKSGKAKIAAGALMPHEIVGAALKGGDDGGEVSELQWKRMVDDLKGKDDNKLENCIGICDVSSSMEGTPMDVCLSLGILLSELSEEPWKGKVITFSENPELHMIRGSSLYEKAMFIRKLKWGMSSNFLRVLELILYVAVQAKLTPEQMIKRVFVFSDMEFDKATAAGINATWETDYMAIRRKYEENGFKEAVPEIVFWNLRDSRSTPVTKKQKGVALVSGFSKNAMKLFLQGKQGDPQAVMDDALSGEEYDNLVVID